MHGLYVPIEGPSLGGLVGTEWAGVRSFPGMNTHVSLQVTGSDKSLGAQVTPLVTCCHVTRAASHDVRPEDFVAIIEIVRRGFQYVQHILLVVVEWL